MGIGHSSVLAVNLSSIRSVSDGGGLTGFFRALARPQVLRTCKKCGYSWTVPRYYTKRHFRGLSLPPGATQVSPRGTGLMTPVTGQEVDETRKESEEVTRTHSAYATCARCGSDTYSQRRLWHESKSQFDGDDEPG